MNVKEFDNFFQQSVGHLPIFHPHSVHNCKFYFSVQNAKFRDFIRFPSETILFSPKRWWHGVVVSTFVVNRHCARLLLGWVTACRLVVSGYVISQYSHLGQVSLPSLRVGK